MTHLNNLYGRVTPALWLAVAILLSSLALPAHVYASALSGTIKDPSGAVIPGAHIQITGDNLVQPVETTSDATGKFLSPDLKPGKYTLRVTKEAFEDLVKTIEVSETTQLELTLEIALQETSIEVSGKALANSDPVYKELRGVGLGEALRLDNFTLNADVATFHFEKGTLTWLRPVENVVTGAVFVGEGHFHLKAVTKLDANEINRRTGNEEVDEDFTEVVFRFTRGERAKFQAGLGTTLEPSGEVASVFEHWKERMRHRREYPLGFTDSVLDGETMDNVDADVLAAVYNPQHPAFFNAYVRGIKHKDLRFFVRTRVGALPQLDSSEEVSLVNFDPEGSSD